MGCPFCKVFHNKSEEWCRQTRKGVQVGISDPNGADCARIAFNLSLQPFCKSHCACFISQYRQYKHLIAPFCFENECFFMKNVVF